MKNYQDMMKTPMDFQSVEKRHSEFKKPYVDKKNPFQALEAQSDPPPGMPMYFEITPSQPPDPDMIVFNCFFSSCHIPGERRKHRLACTQYIMDIAAWSWDIEKVEAFYWYIHGQKVVTMDLQPKSTAEGSIQFVVTMDGGGGTRGRYYLTVPECSADCDCSGAYISASSLQMSVNQAQTLSVGNADNNCSYTWELASGGGSLSTMLGQTTIYTAPSSNANCANNPTINLKCEGILMDTISFAVNALDDGSSAARYCDTTYAVPKWREYTQTYYCTGALQTSTTGGYAEDTQQEVLNKCVTLGNMLCIGEHDCSGIWQDIRTAGQLANGCCPYQLL